MAVLKDSSSVGHLVAHLAGRLVERWAEHWEHWRAEPMGCHLAGKWEQSSVVYWAVLMAVRMEPRQVEHSAEYLAAMKAGWWGNGTAATTAECLVDYSAGRLAGS